MSSFCTVPIVGSVVALVKASSRLEPEPGGHGSISHSSGTPLPLQSALEPPEISHSSGMPLALQSSLEPDPMSHESALPLPLQSTIEPGWQTPATQVSMPLHGSPSSHSPFDWQPVGAEVLTALCKLMRPDPSKPMYEGFCASMLSTVVRTRSQTWAAVHVGLRDHTAAAVGATI